MNEAENLSPKILGIKLEDLFLFAALDAARPRYDRFAASRFVHFSKRPPNEAEKTFGLIDEATGTTDAYKQGKQPLRADYYNIVAHFGIITEQALAVAKEIDGTNRWVVKLNGEYKVRGYNIPTLYQKTDLDFQKIERIVDAIVRGSSPEMHVPLGGKEPEGMRPKLPQAGFAQLLLLRSKIMSIELKLPTQEQIINMPVTPAMYKAIEVSLRDLDLNDKNLEEVLSDEARANILGARQIVPAHRVA